MNYWIKLFFVLIVCGLTWVANGQRTFAQQTQDDGIELKIKTFLENSDELRNYAKSGFSSRFTGEFRSIPKDLKLDLKNYFPEYEICVATMNVLIDPPESKYELILFFNVNAGRVDGFIWGNYWMMPASKSFRKTFMEHQAQSKESAIEQIRTLAKLIAWSHGDNAGTAKMQNRTITVELYRGEGIFGKLKVKMSRDLRFVDIFITDSNGKKIKTFV